MAHVVNGFALQNSLTLTADNAKKIVLQLRSLESSVVATLDRLIQDKDYLIAPPPAFNIILSGLGGFSHYWQSLIDAFAPLLPVCL